MFKRTPKAEIDDTRPAVRVGDQTLAQVTAELRQIMPDLYFINTSSSQMARHLQLLHRIPDEQVIIDHERRPHSQLTELTLCAFDDGQPGLLSGICGLMAAQRIDIHTGYIFTIAPPLTGANQGRRVVLDTLLISERIRGHARALSATRVAKLCTDLGRVLKHETSVKKMLNLGSLRPTPPLTIEAVSAVNSKIGDRTLVSLRAQNAPGILYRTTAALAFLGLDIRVAQVNTENNVTNDVFFVTDQKGEAVPEADLAGLQERLRLLLMQDAIAEHS